MDNTQELLPLTRQLKWLKIVSAIMTLVLLAAIGFLYARVRAEQQRGKNFAFTVFSLGYERDQDLLAPQVGTIQFLKRGYSVVFEKVEYTGNGLVLKGRIGNPSNLWVSSLTLRFDARPSIYKLDEKWHEFRKWGWNDEWNIGSAQTNVGLLAPGTTSSFEVTIPNVKQTPEALEIAVFFMGESYSYAGK